MSLFPIISCESSPPCIDTDSHTSFLIHSLFGFLVPDRPLSNQKAKILNCTMYCRNTVFYDRHVDLHSGARLIRAVLFEVELDLHPRKDFTFTSQQEFPGGIRAWFAVCVDCYCILISWHPFFFLAAFWWLSILCFFFFRFIRGPLQGGLLFEIISPYCCCCLSYLGTSSLQPTTTTTNTSPFFFVLCY